MQKGNIKVGGMEYEWEIFRQPRWVTDDIEVKLLGLAILVRSKIPSTRELLLEFSIDRSKHGDMPQHQRFRINEKKLAESIHAAMDAGWDPESRGKKFVFPAGSPL